MAPYLASLFLVGFFDWLINIIKVINVPRNQRRLNHTIELLLA